MISHPTRSLFLVALGHLVVELSSQFMPVLYPVLMDVLSLSYTQIGIVSLVHGLGTTLVQPFFGYLSDRWDRRAMVVLSIAWLGALMGLVGLTRSYPWLLLVNGLAVLGSAAFHPAAMNVVSSCGKRRRGAATSVFSLGGALGSALSPLLITWGVVRMGLQSTLLVILPALLGAGVLLWLLGRRQAAVERVEQADRAPIARTTVVSLVLIVLAVMFLSWFQWSFRTYLPAWLQERGQSLAAAGRTMFVFTLAISAGTLLGGALSDRIGRWPLLAACLALIGPTLWLFLSLSGLAQWGLVILMGVLIGATFPISIVMAQDAWPAGVGTASGLVMGLGWVPGGLGSSLTGYLADRYDLTFGLRLLLLPALLSVLCILAYALVQRRAARRAPPAPLADPEVAAAD
jgi:FSR family fosmidomycin resistance protein-like MFS transporter